MVAFIAAEEILNAGIGMVKEEELDVWEDGNVYRVYAAPLC